MHNNVILIAPLTYVKVECGKCGQYEGTRYYHRCYKEEAPETPSPTPAPAEPGMCGKQCAHDRDCKSQYAGTYNPCMKCSRHHRHHRGTMWMCIDPRKEDEMIGANDLLDADVTELWDYSASEDEDSSDLIDSEDSKIDWGNAWNKTKSGTKEAARRTAEGGKKAADKTKEWGKKTFKPDSPAATMSSVFGIVSLGLASVLYYVVG